jgi:hypothetical protein
MNLPLKLLRYNTGNDKHAFMKFKNEFDAVIFNATIVAYSGSAVADLVSVHKNKYIIDPQTHIFQHEISAISSKKTGEIKKSVLKYLSAMPDSLNKIIVEQKRAICTTDISTEVDTLVDMTYKLQTEFISKFISNKEYDKYLSFANMTPEPLLVIAPYFMLKKRYTSEENQDWLHINQNCLERFIEKTANKFPVSAQLVMDSDILLDNSIFAQIEKCYCIEGFDYIFVWIDNFDSFTATPKKREGFYNLLSTFTKLKIKPIMAYGGYDSILLCNKEVTNRMYGVAQSVGYGESREVTPVGGGLPVNKYYFFPTHQRLKFNDVAIILTEHGYFSKKNSPDYYASQYYQNICNCNQCKEIVRNNIDNFIAYNEAISFEMNTKRGIISRNRPTTNAALISAFHFMYCKVEEWKNTNQKSLPELKMELLNEFKKYMPSEYTSIKAWSDLYAK